MLFSALLTLTTLVASAFAVGPGVVKGSTDVHDPTMCKDNTGKWWLFATAPGISIRTSTDRTTWTYVGVVWPNGSATWTNQYTGTSNGNIWAPDCTYIGGTFHLFYAASSFGSQNSAIFYATSTTGLPGSWTNRGLVTSTSTTNNYNAIDPGLLVDGSRWILALGSFWSGIKYIELNPSTGKPLNSAVTALATRPSSVGGAVEAPKIFKNGSFYYLFVSWDKCCSGTSSTYNIRVGRSSSPTGPFVDKANVALTNGGGTLVLATNGNWIGPGGQDVYQDGDGPILVYHYYNSAGSWLGINRLDFSSGWPVVV